MGVLFVLTEGRSIRKEEQEIGSTLRRNATGTVAEETHARTQPGTGKSPEMRGEDENRNLQLKHSH